MLTVEDYEACRFRGSDKHCLVLGGYCPENIGRIACTKTVEGLKRERGCEFCHGVEYIETPFTVMSDSGIRKKVPFRFCPSCGRDLIGDDE